ncbi:MAG: GNAT family N-acetyltransferase [Lachnospiraceae bacterium]|nr:GNAT family N-acetyltransferase [Lachnospiraceae bacterium]
MESLPLEDVTFTDSISIEDYNGLREAVDWMLVKPRRAEIALAHSFYLCVAIYGGRPVGMVRVVSDGGWSFLITDVIVKPEYQGRHIGKKMITMALEYIEKDLLPGESVMISLMSAYKKEGFYEKFGFHKRPFGNHGSGMSAWMTRNEAGEIVTEKEV